ILARAKQRKTWVIYRQLLDYTGTDNVRPAWRLAFKLVKTSCNMPAVQHNIYRCNLSQST
ncbi:MAG: hypothetical protein KBT09_02045, partial [Bacteroidales bacterium]|nr:hypothetical protein [Candidatus Sodaliphilus fimicaballi]